MSNDKHLMEDAEDEGLKAVMGSKFKDMSREIPTSTVPPRNDKVRREMEQKYPDNLKTISDCKDTERNKLMDGEWGQLNRVSPMAKLKDCAKGVWLYGCISLLLFWWQQAGLLDSKAAVPSFIVLALLAGVQIGSACRE